MQVVTTRDLHRDGDRWRSIGIPDPDFPLLLFVVHTGDAEHGGRIISARRASRSERKVYETYH